MSTLQIIFSVNLKQDRDESIYYAPIFYNWTPTEKDYLILYTLEPDTTLRVWFDTDSQVDMSAISDKNIIVVDKLKGKLEINNIAPDIVSIFETNKTQYIPYEEFGKKVIKKMIYPTLSRLFNILRINYGQYWIPQLLPWNSLETGLREYCQMLEMKWSIDDNTWIDFIPDRRVGASIRFRVAGQHFFEQFILKNDWQILPEFINNRYEPTVAATLLSRAHQYGDQGDFRSSFIEGISALELAIREFIQPKIANNNTLLQSMNQFWEMPIKSKVIAITTTMGTIPIDDIENTMKAIDIRNKIAHQGFEPPGQSSKTILSGLFRTISALLSGPKFKFPQISI